MNTATDAFLTSTTTMGTGTGTATAAGQALPHESARLHVAGQATYIDDMP